MASLFAVLLAVTMLAVLGVLAAGLVGVARGLDARRSNALMRARVLLQGLALLFFVLLVLSRGGH